MLHNIHQNAGRNRRQSGAETRRHAHGRGAGLSPSNFAAAPSVTDPVFRHRLSKVLSAFHAPPDETGQNSEDSDLDDGVDNEEMRRLQTERDIQAMQLENAARRVRCWRPFNILHPTCPFKIAWDICLMVLILYSVWAIPFRIGFEIEGDSVQFWIDLVMDLFFLMDIIVNSHTAYHTSLGLYVDDRKLVFKHYCLTWGPIDVLSTVPFDLIGEAFLDDNALFLRTFRLFRVLRMVRLLKLARLLKMRKTLAALEGIWTVHTGVFRLFRLIAEVMFIAHLLACMWHFIPLLEAPPTSGRSSWFNVAGIDDSTALSTRYTIALYWSTKTMMSVGYGDVHAVSTAERIYSIFTQCVGVSAFGFIVANISSLISTLDVRGSALTERLSEVREYLHDRKVPFDLQRRVMKFFHHLWSHGSLFDELGILASLPPPLRNDIVFWGRSDTIQRIKLLNGQDRHLISMLVTRLKPLAVEPQDVLAAPHSTADQVYFVMQGVVEGYIPRPASAEMSKDQINASVSVDVVQVKSKQKGVKLEKRFMEVVAVYTAGSHCGHSDIVAGTSMSVGLRALTSCHLQTLGKRDLMHIMSLFMRFTQHFTKQAKEEKQLLDLAVAAVHERFRNSSKWLVRELPVLFEGELTIRSIIPGYSEARRQARAHQRSLIQARGRTEVDGGLKIGAKALLKSFRASFRNGGGGRSRRALDITGLDSPVSAGAPLSPHSVQGLPDDTVARVQCRISAGDSERPGRCCCWTKRRSRDSVVQIGNTSRATLGVATKSIGMSPQSKKRVLAAASRQSMAASFMSARKSGASLAGTAVAVSSPHAVPVVANQGEATKQGDADAGAGALPSGNSPIGPPVQANGEAGHFARNMRPPAVVTTGPAIAFDSHLVQIDSNGTPHSNASGHSARNEAARRQSPKEYVRSQIRGLDFEQRKREYAKQDTASKRRLFMLRLQRAADSSELQDGDDMVISGKAKDVLYSQKELLLRQFVLLGSGWWRISWDIFMTLVVIISVILTPYRIAFDQGNDIFDPAWVLETVLDCCFVLDIVANFRTSYPSSSKEFQIAVPSMIAKRYLRHWFALDLVTTLPFDTIVRLVVGSGVGSGVHSISILRMLRLLKLARLFRLGNLLSTMEDTPALSLAPSLFRLLKLLFKILFGAHLLGCFWYFVAVTGSSDADSTSNWWDAIELMHEQANLGEPTAGDRYVASVYFAFCTITTVGYGDIVPKTDFERIFVIIAVTCGATVFGYVLGSVTALVARLSDSSNRHDAKLKEVAEYLKEINASTALTKRVKKHFNFLFGIRSQYNEQLILEELPPSLRNEIILHTHRATIDAIPFLQSDDEVFVATVVQLLTPLQYPPGALVYRKGEVGLDMYFITHGQAEILVRNDDAEDGNQVVSTLGPGDFFGEMSLLLESDRVRTVRAKSILQVFALGKEDVAAMLMEYPSLEGSVKSALERAAHRMSRRQANEVRHRMLAETYGHAWRDIARNKAAAKLATKEAAKRRPAPVFAVVRSGTSRRLATEAASAAASKPVSKPARNQARNQAPTPAAMQAKPPSEVEVGVDVPTLEEGDSKPSPAAGAVRARSAASLEAHVSGLGRGSSRNMSTLEHLSGVRGMRPYVRSVAALDAMIRHANRLHPSEALSGLSSRNQLLMSPLTEEDSGNGSGRFGSEARIVADEEDLWTPRAKFRGSRKRL